MSILKGFNKCEYINCDIYPNAPCYRTLISIAFFEFYLHSQSLDETKEEIYNFNHAVNEFEQYILKFNFFGEDDPILLMEYYPLEILEELGAVYIDHTHTCYPLVLYPQAHKIKNSTRIDAFFHAVKDVYINVDNLLALYHRYEIIKDISEEEEKLLWPEYREELHKFMHN
ncbi:hypothetical protein ACD661_11710 [Legionella lytica]|uniref:Uncharacterized protein n=1 Tax=Legionella lytica TaxID=96232 RepID=A0ABW8D935_9GAMM